MALWTDLDGSLWARRRGGDRMVVLSSSEGSPLIQLSMAIQLRRNSMVLSSSVPCLLHLFFMAARTARRRCSRRSRSPTNIRHLVPFPCLCQSPCRYRRLHAPCNTLWKTTQGRLLHPRITYGLRCSRASTRIQTRPRPRASQRRSGRTCSRRQTLRQPNPRLLRPVHVRLLR